MSNLRAPLDKLLHNNGKFVWTNECNQAFEQFKNVLNSDLLLTHYNPDLPIKVAADASGKGIGAFICHIMPDGTEKVIAHAACTLTPNEQKYSQIEKEALALIFAVKKLHRFIFGGRFIRWTDHKPLLNIFGSKKGIPVHTANRLQRWALTLMRYDYELQYVNTKNFGCVDTLSRLVKEKEPEDMVIACTQLERDMSSMLSDQLNKIPVTFKMIKHATTKCKQLQKVIKALGSGWGEKVEDVLLPYYRRRDSLSIVEGCVLFGERIVIPTPFRRRILHQLHRGHPGKERMKSIARCYVFWPRIDEEIELVVRECQPCAMAARSPIKSTPQPWPKASKPMERLHIDIAGPSDGIYYLVAVDAYSKWPEIFQTNSITSSAVVAKMDELFARYGNCDTIVSDNGTQFVSTQFEEFLKKRGVNHVRTAPYHPQSNGQAEKFVDTLKRALVKLKNEGTNLENLQTFLQTYRSTPNPNTPNGKTPAEAFLGRKIKTSLDLLSPPVSQQPPQRNQLIKCKKKSQRELEVGDVVYARIYHHNTKHWASGTVIERVGRVNYNILLTENQKLIRSHINQLRRRYVNANSNDSARLLCDSFDLYNVSQRRESSDCNLDQPVGMREELGQPVNMLEESEAVNVSSPRQHEQEEVVEEGSDSEYLSSSSVPDPQPTIDGDSRPRRQIKTPAWLDDYVVS